MSKRLLLLGTTALGILVLAYIKWPIEKQGTIETLQNQTEANQPHFVSVSTTQPLPPSREEVTYAIPKPDDTYEQPTEVPATSNLDREAINSFKQSLTETPPYVPLLSAPFEFSQATQEQIDDHEKYAEFEDSNRQRLKQSFVKAARAKIEQLDRLIEQGKRYGIEEHKIQEGLQKRKAIADLMQALEAELNLEQPY